MGETAVEQVVKIDDSTEQTEKDPKMTKELHVKHPLQNTWSLWFFKNDKTKSWANNLRKITDFDTVEDFWGIYNHIQVPSKIGLGCDYSLFKEGIRPMWEDPKNRCGGRWLVNLSKTQRMQELDRLWLETLLCLIGESFGDDSDQICGAVVQLRPKGDKLAVWTSQADNSESVINIGKQFKERLTLPQKFQIAYEPAQSPFTYPEFTIETLEQDPPVVGKVTHSSVELIWDKTILAESSSSVLSKGRSLMKYIVQEDEVKGLATKGYGTVYSGVARKNNFTGLEPRTTYRYRIKYKQDSKESAWSRPVEVTTTVKPPSSEDLVKAVSTNDIEKVQKLLTQLNRDLIDAPDKYGYSPLMIAVLKGYTGIAKVLLENGADVNYENNSGRNAVMSACLAGQLESSKMLRSYGAPINTCDRSGLTPLHCSIDGNNAALVQWLLQEGCRVDYKNRITGWTPLMRLASLHGDVEIAKILVNHGADVNATDNNKKTVLMMAVVNGHTELIEYLLSKGSKLETKSVHQKTALDFARSFGKIEIIKTLEEHRSRLKEGNCILARDEKVLER